MKDTYFGLKKTLSQPLSYFYEPLYTITILRPKGGCINNWISLHILSSFHADAVVLIMNGENSDKLVQPTLISNTKSCCVV